MNLAKNSAALQIGATEVVLTVTQLQRSFSFTEYELDIISYFSERSCSVYKHDAERIRKRFENSCLHIIAYKTLQVVI